MPNRMIAGFNQMIEESKLLTEYYTRSYLREGTVFGAGFAAQQFSVIRDINCYYRLNGFWMYGDSEENRKTMADLSRALLGVTRNSGYPISFTIYGRERETGIYYGMNLSDKDTICSLLKTYLSGVTIQNQWLEVGEQEQVQRYNGFVSGISTLEPVDLDNLIQAMGENRYMVNVLLCPIPGSAVNAETRAVQGYVEQLRQVSDRVNTFGNNQQRNFSTVNTPVVQCIDILTKEEEKLKKAQLNGGWKVLVHYSSDEFSAFKLLERLLSATFNTRMDNSSNIAGTNLISVNDPFLKIGKWYYPELFFGRKNYGGLYHNSIVNILDINTAGHLIHPPMRSHHNYLIRRIGDSSGTPFETYRSPENRDMLLGELKNGTAFNISEKDLIQHVFITGTTGYGKTTTALTILNLIHRKGIPFVVIESEKKDYWKLLEHEEMKDLRVYSYGRDAIPLYLNPFEPEPGTMLNNHIEGLITAFLSMFNEEDPLPQILRNLIYLCYEKKGWDTNIRFNGTTTREWPVLQDLLDNLEECVQQIGYDEEVKNNMIGVVRVRVSSLIRVLGEYYNNGKNTPVDELFSHSSIIELDDLTYSEKPFVSALIALKVHEYVRNQGDGRTLKRMLVIEEAHNILANVDKLSVSNSGRLCSEYFDHMISVSSGLGLGMMIIDQQPSRVNQGVLANTGMKIIHALSNNEITTMATALHLDKKGEETIMRQGIGEAVVKCPNDPGIYQVSIKTISRDRECLAGCLFCKACKCCNSTQELISDYERIYVEQNGFNVDSLRTCLRFIEHRSNKSLTVDEKMCIGGMLGQRAKIHEQRQTLYNLFREERGDMHWA